MKINFKILHLIFILASCSSPQEQARKNPNTSANLCPNLGTLSEKSLNSDSIYKNEAGHWRVSVVTLSGKIKVFNKNFFIFAKDINDQNTYAEFLEFYKEICNSEPPFNNEIKYIQEEEKARKEWEMVNKKSVKSLIEFNKSSKNEELKKEVAILKSQLLDQKIKDHLISKYSFTKKHLNQEVIYTNGETSEYKFYELFRSVVLSKQMQTGKKMPLVLEEKDGKIIWTVENNNIGVIFYFREYKDKIVLDKILQRRGVLQSTVAGQAVDFLALGIFSESTRLPDDEDLDDEIIK